MVTLRVFAGSWLASASAVFQLSSSLCLLLRYWPSSRKRCRRAICSGPRKLMLVWSSSKLRLIRRPPHSCMPRQFLNGSLIKRLVGMLVMVLSQFCTLTVCRAMSITSPSAFSCGISTQSPTRMMSLEVICTLATSDSRVSWKISISTAAMAPRPESRISGERSISVASIRMAASAYTAISSTCR
ncbi:hypothetical protein D3C86_1682570 [compost metagenome]